MRVASPETTIRAWYSTLSQVWGRQHWWPAESALEVIVGAILTQNTAWTNVEKALVRLRDHGALSLSGLRTIGPCELEELIRSSGYFRQKTQRLKTFIAFLDLAYGGSLDAMFSAPTERLRAELLLLNGVGPETADSILLYAGNHPVFVVDAYTRRILHRHAVLPYASPYEEIRLLFERALADADACVSPATVAAGAGHPPSAVSTQARTASAQAFNDMHAWIVGIGKRHCLKSAPVCEGCPLRPHLPPGGLRELPQAK